MTAIIDFTIQEAFDGPGLLTQQDDGKFLMWDGNKRQFSVASIRSPRLMVAGGGGQSGGGTSTIAGATDFGGTTGAGTDGYAIIWDDNAGEFTLGTFEAAGAVAAHVLEADPHTQYLLATDYNPITDHGALSGLADNDHPQYLLASGYTAADVLSKLLTVDGSGSGLDADLLDGNSSAAFEVAGTSATHAALTAAHGATGEVVGTTNTQTLSGKTLTTPTIASFTNAAHNHQDAAGGATLDHGLALTGLTDDDHTQYLLATGARAGATSQAQTFTNGIASGAITVTDTSNAAGGIVVTKTSTASTTTFGANITANHSGTGNFGGLNVGANTTGSNNTAVALSFQLQTIHGSSGTIGSWYGAFYSRTSNGGTVTNAYGNYLTDIAGAGAVTTNYALYVAAQTRGATNYALYTNAGLVRFGDKVQMAAGTTAGASLGIATGVRPTAPVAGDTWSDGALTSYQVSAATNTIVNSFKLERGSSGTPAAGFGLGIVAQLESTTTETQDAGRLTWAWETATHASRASRGQLSAYYTSTERPAITWGANSTVALLSFYDITTPIARQVLATGAGALVDDVITALQNLGLVKQS